MNTLQDPYPSRCGAKPGLIPRLDPVVYTPDRQRAPLRPALLDSYERNGFMVLDRVFDEAEVAEFRSELDRLCADPRLGGLDEVIAEPDSGAIRSIFQVHTHSELFARLMADHRLVDLARYILDDDVYIHQSRLNYKPGFHGREFHWHSDFETWHVEDGMPRMRAVSMSIVLTRNTEYNGPLMLVPGSHRDYVICDGETPANHYRSSLKRQEYGVPENNLLESLVDRGGIHVATAEAGSVIVFDCNTMHGSNSNITPMPRSNVFMVYNAVSNRIGAPYGGCAPRPEFLAARGEIQPIEAVDLWKQPRQAGCGSMRRPSLILTTQDKGQRDE